MAKDQSWIADILEGYRQVNVAGVDIGLKHRNILNLIGATVVDNPDTVDLASGLQVGSTDVTISGELVPQYVVQLASYPSPSSRAIVIVDGYSAAGDGGGGTFIWQASDTRTDDGGTILQVSGVTTGRWNRIYTGALAPEWFGAEGDGSTDDSTALAKAFTALSQLNGGVLQFGPYTYAHSATLTVPPNTIVQGVNRGYSSAPGPISRLLKTTPGDSLSTALSQVSQLATSIVVRDLNVSNSFCAGVSAWQSSHTYVAGNTVRPALSGANGPNRLAYSTRFLKCIVGGTTGTYQPIGQLYSENGSAYPPAVTITGTPANDLPMDIQVTGDTSFTWSQDRGATSTVGAIVAGPIPLGATGLSATFSTTNYTGLTFSLYTTPTFKWSLNVGTTIMDGSVTWEVIDAGAGINDVGGGGWAIERCVIGSGCNTGLILDFSENFNAISSTFGGGTGSRVGVWICDGGENMCGRSSTACATDNTNVIAFTGCLCFGACAGMVDDGGNMHTFTGTDFEDTQGFVGAGIDSCSITGCYTESPNTGGGSGFTFNEGKYLSVLNAASYGVAMTGCTMSGIYGVDARGFRNNGQTVINGLSINGGFMGDGAVIALIGGAGNIVGLDISPSVSLAGGSSIPLMDQFPSEGRAQVFDGRSIAGAAGAPGVGGLGLGSVAQPQSTLDVLGGFSLRGVDLSLANGSHNNIQLAQNGNYVPVAVQRIIGPTGAFEITGMGVTFPDTTFGAPPGALVRLINVSAGTLTIGHQNASSAAANRFICPNSVDLVCQAGVSFVDCWYDSAQSRWIVLA
jgi:hypothetical protein